MARLDFTHGTEVVGATGTRAARARLAMERGLSLSLLLASLVLIAVGIPRTASASGAPVGSVSMGSQAGGNTAAATGMGPRVIATPRGQSNFSLRQFDSGRFRFTVRDNFARRFHHHNRHFFGQTFFPFGFFDGFGWPSVQSELAQAPVGGDDVGDSSPPFQGRPARYEPPKVETTASGVTIIRGPGSHHGISLP